MKTKRAILSQFFLLIISLAFIACNNKPFADGRFSFKKTDKLLVVTNGEISFVVHPVSAEIIKVSAINDTVIPSLNPTMMLALEENEPIPFSVKEKQQKLLVETSGVSVEITKEPFSIHFLSETGEKMTSQTHFTVMGEKKTTKFSCQNSTAFYGMGQKSIPVNRRGYAFNTANIHIGGYTKEYATQQVNIPYVYTNENYGVFFDNTFTGFFDLAKSAPDEWSYRTDGGVMTYYFVANKNLQGLQNSYYQLTGYPTLPPKWTLGLMQSKCGYLNENEVYSVVDTFEKHQLPLDAIILDAYWFGGYGEGHPQLMGNFTWLKSNFPDPKGYMAKLKKKGIKTITINEPQINVNSENFDMLAEKGWLMRLKGEDEPHVLHSFWAGAAALLDLTNPQVQEWLWSKQKANVELGLDGFWVDLTEPDATDTNGVFQMGPEPMVHNIYSFLFAKTLWDGFQQDYPNRRLFNVTRAGTAGMQRFGAVHWSGDASKTFLALKLQIPMLLGCSMSGMPHYSSDIGGFTNAWDTISVPWNEYKGGPGVTSPELYTRWFQFGVFSPSLRPHSGEGQSCEPFAFNKTTLDITSEYLKLRYRLIPYLYTYAYKTASTGEQLIKPLFMEFKDEKCNQTDYEYMFGDLLVAPVFEQGADTRELYLPQTEDKGKWVSFWDNKSYEGGQTLVVDAPLDKIPVFAKPGAIVPLAKVKKYVGESPDDTLTLKVYPSEYSSFTLYEDEGINRNHEKGEYALTKIECQTNENTITLTIHPIEGEYKGIINERTWHIELCGISNIKSAKVNSTTLADSEYHVDSEANRVAITHSGNTSELTEIIINK